MAQQVAKGYGKGRNRQQRGQSKKSEQTAQPGQPGKKATYPWINSQIISAAETGNVNHLVAVIDAHLMEMNLVNLSTGLHRLARMTSNDHNYQMQLRRTLMPKLLVSLREALRRAIESHSPPKPQALSNITWALASLQLPDIQLIEMLAVQASMQVSDFKHFELSTILWALAKLGSIDSAVHKYSQPVFIAAAQFIVQSLAQFTFRGLVMTVWAYATAKQHDARLFRAVSAQILPQVHTANSQELANTAWSFATAGVHRERLFTRLAEEAKPRLAEFKPQELSSLLWSFAAIGFSHEAFFEAAAVLVKTLPLQAQQLANILWGLTRARARLPSTQEAVLALLPRCTKLIKTFKPQELASVSLAAAKCFGQRVDDDEIDMKAMQPSTLPPEVRIFFLTALPLVSPDLNDFSGQSVANIASSFLAVQIGLESGLFPAVGYEVMIRAEKLENSALLLLLKTLPRAPRSAPVHGAMCILFGEAARRANSMQTREMTVLSRICSMLMDVENTGQTMSAKDLCECCLVLAKTGPVENVKQLTQMASNDRPKQPVKHSANKNSKNHAAQAAAQARPAQSAQAAAAAAPAFSMWNAPLTVGIASTNSQASPWDAEAMQQMRDSVQNTAIATDPLAFKDGEAAPEGQDTEKPAPHFVFSVKNTFLDVAQELADPVEEEPPIPLDPPLDFIPDSVSPEKLAAFRSDYARFRVGNAIGAKGELTEKTMS